MAQKQGDKKRGDRSVVASAGANPAKEVRPEAIAALKGQTR